MNIRRKIIEFIIDFNERHGRSPAPREIRKMFSGMTEDVDLHLAQLEREGLLEIGLDAVQVILTYAPVPQIGLQNPPHIGRCSRKFRTYQGSLSLDLRALGIPTSNDMHAIQIVDDSMLDAGFEAGDLAILQAAVPRAGDIVEVELNGQPVLRRYLIVSGVPHILAENPLAPELRLAWDFPIRGVFFALLRVGSYQRTIGHRPSTKQVSYSQAKRCVGKGRVRSATEQVAASDVVRACGTKRKCDNQFSRAKYRSKFDGEWPAPPSDIQLNEEANFKTIEAPATYGV